MAQMKLLGSTTGAIADSDVVETIQRYALGTAGYDEEGRVWRYCKQTSSAAIVAGELQVGVEIVANHQNLATNAAALVTGALEIPSGTITLGATALTANQYAEGTIMVVDGGGEGSYYKIRSHDAGTSGGTDFTVKLFSPIRGDAEDANTEVSFFKNLYDSPQQSNTDQADVAVGVANVDVGAGDTTPQYFWAQTQGLCACFVVGTPAVGSPMMISATTAGRMDIVDETSTGTSAQNVGPVVGYMRSVGITGEVQAVELAIRGL